MTLQSTAVYLERIKFQPEYLIVAVSVLSTNNCVHEAEYLAFDRKIFRFADS